MIHIRRGGDHRCRTALMRYFPRKVIRPAEMARQKRDHKLPGLVQTDHGRVFRFIPEKRRNCPDADPGSAHENEGLRL